MPEYVGSIPSLELSRWLLALPALPLLAATVALLQTRRGEDRQPSLRAQALLHVAPWAALLLAASAALVRLTSMTGAYRLLIAPGWQIVHIGSHELSFGLSLDTLSLSHLPVLCAGWGAAALWAVVSDVADGARKARLAAAVQATGACSLVALLADGLPALVMGLGLGCVAIGTGWLELGAGQRGWGRAIGARAAALTLSVLAMMTVFWAMSGEWTAAGFAPALRPRVVVMQPESMVEEQRVVVPGSKPGEDSERERREQATRARTSRPDAKGYLTMTAMSGARVFLDGSTTAFAQAPFVREPLLAGMHAAKVVPGPGSNDIELPTFRIDEGVETMVIAASGTTSFREATTLTMVKSEGHTLALGAKPSEHAAAALALLGFLLTALTLTAPAQAALGAGASLAFGLLPAAIGGYAMVRVSAMLGGEPTIASVLGASLLTALLGAGAVSATRSGDDATSVRVLLLAFGAQLGVSGAAAASGATAAAGTHLLIATAGASLALLAIEVLRASPAARRWGGLLRLGGAALSSLLPLSGAFSLLEAMRGIGACGLADWVVALSLALSALGASASAVATAVTLHQALRPAAPAQPRNKRLRRDEATERGPDAFIALAALPSALVLALACVATGPLSASSLYDAPLSRLMTLSRLPIPPGDTGSMLPIAATALVLIVAGLGWVRASQLAKSSARAPAPEATVSLLSALSDGLSKAGSLLVRFDAALAGGEDPTVSKGEDRKQESR